MTKFMIKVHESFEVIDSKDSSWQETLEYKTYYLNPKNTQVTEVTTHKFENVRRPENNWEREVGRKILKAEEISEEVRRKIKELDSRKR